MKIVIAGGSGFLGQALVRALEADGHDLIVLSRTLPSERSSGTVDLERSARVVTWTPDGKTGLWAAAVDGAHAVINLAGDSIANGRWSGRKKRRIFDSRVRATRSLAGAIARAPAPPPLFLSGSGVGYYGPCGDEVVTEAHPAGRDFLAGVCAQWEQEARRAASDQTRVVCIRTGLVLDKHQGALPRMLLPFRLGVGGRLGSGRQYMPWIHRQDWVDLIRFLLKVPSASGPVNATAPTPVPNAEFTRILGRVLRRPTLLPAPGFALKLMLGEMAGALLLSGQRAVPAEAERLGFTFNYPDLDGALREELGHHTFR